jgi:SAM-dependent methyltransferase
MNFLKVNLRTLSVNSDWSELAKQWEEYGAPFRPAKEVVQIFEKETIGKTLLLGATPELQKLAYLAVDNDLEALRIHKPPTSILADWRALPLPTSHFDTVIGDGSLNVLNDGFTLLFPEIKRILKPEGQLILRVFISPEKRDSLESVIGSKNQFKGFLAFKLALYQALANPFARVMDVHKIAASVWSHPNLLIKRDPEAVLYFPKLSELPTWSKIQYASSYELADRCPIITWRMMNVDLV